eukprot:366232-Chlamydomonas_euryale.AAC.23
MSAPPLLPFNLPRNPPPRHHADLTAACAVAVRMSAPPLLRFNLLRTRQPRHHADLTAACAVAVRMSAPPSYALIYSAPASRAITPTSPPCVWSL